MHYSYDIFDTVIYRTVPSPSDIFYIMEKLPEVEALRAFSHKAFAICRKRIEFWLRRTRGKEITIEDIYSTLQKKFHLTQQETAKLQEIELNVEREHSFLNKSILEDIKRHIQSGEEVILISDMYWHAEQIRAWLTGKDEIFNQIPIFVSCDWNASKANGKLFNLVKQQKKWEFANWTHTGDHKNADVEIPTKLGIRAIQVPKCQKYDFEGKIDHRNLEMLETYGLIARVRNAEDSAAFCLGVSVAAPLVYQYVEWVITQAVSRGISALYFVMRDGYILKQVADIIIQKRQLPIKTSYIFGSRVAWRLPEMSVAKLEGLSVWDKSNWIFRDPAVAYVPFERLGFSRKEIDELLGPNVGKQPLYSFKDFKSVLAQSLSNSEFKTKLEHHIKAAGDNLDAYLHQTVNFSESFAFVDTNSTGKTQKDLSQFLQKRQSNQVKIPFFYHTYLADTPADKSCQFVFTNKSADDKRFPEAFYRAPYNPCLGYVETKSGTIEPKFHESTHCAWNESFDYDSYLRGILSFASTKETTPYRQLPLALYVDFLQKVVNFKIRSRDLVCQIAELPFQPDMYGDELLDFYPQIRWMDLFHPFSQLIYYPKGSYYRAGGIWIMIYQCLFFLTRLKRMSRNRRNKRYSN